MSQRIKTFRINPKVVLLINIAYMVILFSISPLFPGISWTSIGDFNMAEINYYHGVMIQLAVFGVLLVAYVLNLPRKLLDFFGVSNLIILILNVLSIAFFYPAWAITVSNVVEGIRDFYATIVSIILIIALVVLPFVEENVRSMSKGILSAYTLLIVSIISATIAGIMGLVLAEGIFLNFSNFPSWFMANIETWGGVSTFIDNLSGSHSHEMLPAIGGAMIALAAIEFNYAEMKNKIAKYAVDVGLIVAIFGVISMTISYVISTFGTYEIPTISPSGPYGVNGLALDDFQTGLVGFGSIIVAIALIGGGMLADKLSHTRLLKIMEILTWFAAVFVLVGIGYPIEFNEAFFGFATPGTPKTGGGPGWMYDAAFSRAHLIFAFYLLPIVAGSILAAHATLKGNIVGNKAGLITKISSYLFFFGLVVASDGVIVWTLTADQWLPFVIGISLILVSIFLILHPISTVILTRDQSKGISPVDPTS